MDHPLSSLTDAVALPGHRMVVQHWLALYRAGGQRVPALRDLDALQFPAALPDIWIVDLGDDGRFRFHLLGENMIERHGGNPRGQSFEEIYTPALLPVVSALARRVIEQPAIAYQQAMSVIRNRLQPVPIERIALPLTDAQGRIRHLFGVTIFRSEDNGGGSISTNVLRDDWFPVAEAEIADRAG